MWLHDLEQSKLSLSFLIFQMDIILDVKYIAESPPTHKKPPQGNFLYQVTHEILLLRSL